MPSPSLPRQSFGSLSSGIISAQAADSARSRNLHAPTPEDRDFSLDEELDLPFFSGRLPQTFKEDLDSVPAPRGITRKQKLIILAVILGLVLFGVFVLAFFLQHVTHERALKKLEEARAEWFKKGGTGIPPGFCEEALAALPETDDVHIEQWASDLIAAMTEEEKYRLIRGVGFDGFKAEKNYYVGSVLGVPRLGIPSLKMQDGTAGFRTTDEEMLGQVTSWPCSLALAASWDPHLVREWATAAGEEFKAKGANMALGPAVNVHRTPFGGRNAEFLSGEDPTIGRLLAPEYVKGLQSAGVASVVKHFALNEQETERTNTNSQADARIRWEHYYPPFESSVRAGVAAVMCSYNSVNGVQACSSEEIITEDLKKGMGFEGWVMSDWWAIKDSKAALSGTDMDMPGNDAFFDKNHIFLPDGRLEDMISHMLIGMYRSGAWTNLPSGDCRVGCDCANSLYGVTATNADHVQLARKVAAAGAVLLKNDVTPTGEPILPLKQNMRIAIVGGACGLQPVVSQQMKGWTEGSYYTLGGSSRVLSPDTISFTTGLHSKDVLINVSPGDDIVAAKTHMAGAEVTIVCGGATATETIDRHTLRLDQDAFIAQVAAAGQQMKVPVVVLAYSPGAAVMPWRDQVTAILLMFPSGQATGLAAADIMYGDVTPSAKLPITMPIQEQDAMRPCATPDCPYTEGLKGGWHVYDGRQVAYPFGFGLSYTKFEYVAGPLSDVQQDNSRKLIVTVKNVGKRSGTEIVQLYMRYPMTSPAVGEEPQTLLRRFRRTRELEPDEMTEIVFELGPRDEMIWDKVVGTWQMIYGKFSVGIGSSSRDLRLCGSFTNQLAVTKTEQVGLSKCENPYALPAADGR